MRIATLLASGIALAACSTRADAQTVAPTLAAGIAVPIGNYGVQRSAGPLLRAGLTMGAPERHVRLRVEGEGAWLLDRADGSAALGSQDGTLRALGLLVTLVAGPHLGRYTPYALVGAGPQWIRVAGATNPYGASLGARAGAGLRVRAGRVDLEAEVAAHGVASDFGTGRDFAPGSYVPLAIGVRF